MVTVGCWYWGLAPKWLWGLSEAAASTGTRLLVPVGGFKAVVALQRHRGEQGS